MSEAPRLARGRTWLVAVLSGIRGRMMVLLLAAGIPVTAIAVTNAVQDYRAALDEIRRGAIGLRTVMLERYGGSVGTSEGVLVALARLDPARDDATAGCAALLRQTLELHPGDFADLWVAEPDGRVACRARAGEPEGAGIPLPPEAFTAEGPVLARFAPFPGRDGMVLPLVVPIRRDGRTIRAIAATLIVQRTVREPGTSQARGPVWLVDPGGDPLLVAGPEAGRRPAEGILRRIADTSDVIRAEGDAFAYAAAAVRPGLLLLVGQPVAAVESAARAVLIQRLTELAAFLLVCLAVILVGADLGMVRPLRLLAARVRGWRPGHPFRVSPTGTEPREVREVELAFAEAATALARREADLRAALGQRDALMAEIHHRVKNNLQIVSSLLNLQAGRIVGSPAAAAEFLAARNRVRALATLHRHLYMQQSVEAVSLSPFVTELAQQAFAAHGETPGERIALVLDLAETTMVSADQAVPLALLVTESVGNAVAHAFPDDARGAVRVSVTVADGTALLVIEDDGAGLPDRRERPRGLGLQLMEGFAKQLGGSLEGGRPEGPGTRWTVRFPLRASAAPRSMGD